MILAYINQLVMSKKKSEILLTTWAANLLF